MMKPRKLRRRDKVAIVSHSSGMLGEDFCSHNIEIGVNRLKEYSLEPIFMPNSLKGIEFLKANPKARDEVKICEKYHLFSFQHTIRKKST